MGLFSDFKNDDSAEKDGQWFQYGNNTRIKIARAGGANKVYQKRLDAVSRPYRRQIATDTLTNEQATDILMQVYASVLVKGWETKRDERWESGIENEEGELVQFNTDNVLSTFRSLPDLFTMVRDDAQKGAHYRANLMEEAAKN